MSTKNTTTNGVVKNLPQSGNENSTTKPELSNLVVNAPGQEQQKDGKPEQQEKPKVETVKMPTVEERLKKLEELQDLADRRETLVDALADVKAFNYKSANSTPRLSFSDGKNNFSISNAAVIGELVTATIGKLQSEIAAIESQIAFTF
jgi:hypothetical protein